jgi:4'-phosphopantetheinyl transferase
MSASALPPQLSSHDEAVAWGRGPLRPRISPGEVHVWRAQLDRLGDRRGVLSEAERERERRIASESDRQLWGRSRSVLRVLLARYLDTAPEQVPLAVGANGKPCLEQAHDNRHEADGAEPLHFNLSHSGELALYAFSSSWPVGIDVELAHVEGRRRDHVALTRRVFGEAEAGRLQALAPAAHEREFLRLWTRYEAALKRVGRGIGAGADAGASDAGARDVEGSAWIVELDLGVDGAAALAGERPASALQAWSLV